jgi:class 3 adenylate cyclase/tetratricopeptide (TPR) repeat protein
MRICPVCGHENSDRARFCEDCAAPLDLALAREQRKTVTVIFCDVTGSTALGESTDPEALRSLLARYFERMKRIVERHGGTVEKFIGDAVMAVFGVPQVHEDDALRACKAAVEMRAAMPELGVEVRIGLNTGEVVTGTAERLATGDAVNVAARLEQAAAPGEILFGEPTFELVRDAVGAEAVEPLVLKGKANPVPAFRLLSVAGEGERRHASRFVGRERELAALAEAWETTRSERSCRLVTVVGDAGVGKTRLVSEFVAGLDTRVVRGRCLSYGEGITYWPVVEVVKQLGTLPADPAAAHPLRSLLGEAGEGTSAEEIAWAFRKLLEQEAPLVCLFEDIHWAEETFLDLVEHVALLSSGSSILLVCLARPELIERRPQWPLALRLEPLPDADARALLPETLAEELRGRISRAAGGNPLFLTEMVAMVLASEGEVAVPPTLHALLEARLDQLDQPERQVLERGAVEGEVFHRGAVRALSTDGQVTPRLAALVRRELIRPDRSQLPADDAFRFRHVLIRDAAYQALPKATRANLHERFAVWLETQGAELVELDEILGHHLDQAVRYKHELGQRDPGLAERAAERLAAAGRRALWRGDERAASPLLERALQLTRPLRLDVHLELDFAEAQASHSEKVAIVEAALARAREVGDEAGETLARVVLANRRLEVNEATVDELEALALEAVPVLEDVADHHGLVYVWDALGYGVANFRWRYAEQARAAQETLRHARLAGQPRARLFALDMALVYGPLPADEALRTLDAVMPESPAPGPLLHRAWLLAMLGSFGEAWRIAREAHARSQDLTGRPAGGAAHLAELATLAGDHELEATYLRLQCDALEKEGQLNFLSTYAPRLGRALCALGRHHEAEPLARLGREIGDEDDVATQAWSRQVQALVDAARGEYAEAEALMHEAVAIVERTDALNFQGYALTDLAEVLRAAGRSREAAAALEQALERYERKQNLAMVTQLRPKLASLRVHERF